MSSLRNNHGKFYIRRANLDKGVQSPRRTLPKEPDESDCLLACNVIVREAEHWPAPPVTESGRSSLLPRPGITIVGFPAKVASPNKHNQSSPISVAVVWRTSRRALIRMTTVRAKVIPSSQCSRGSSTLASAILGYIVERAIVLVFSKNLIFSL